VFDIPADAARERGVTVMRRSRATPDELRVFTERALAEGGAGWLHAVIGQRFPLESAATAHAAIGARATVGKTLIEVGPAS
jgi:NADPH:quinone reductase